MAAHQDWNVVVLNPKKTDVERKTVAKSSVASGVSCLSGVNGANGVSGVSASGKPAWKVEAQVDADVGKPVDYVPKDVAQSIVNGRVAMKLTQKDLAARLNMQLKEIQEIESGRAVYNKQVVGRIKRFLQLDRK
jgi:ribosome-binding protein aMBF1 (putative translation factor)